MWLQVCDVYAAPDATKDRCANAEVLAACGRLGMSTRLSLARLRLLGPVLLHGPLALLRLCDYFAARGRGWPSLIVCDLDLVHLHWGEGSLGTGAAAVPAWADLDRCSPDVGERGLDRVERRATAAHVDECLRLVWRCSLDSILFQGCIDLPEGSAAVDVERGFLCYECGCALALSALGVPIVRGCMAPGILLGPWRLVRYVVPVAWSFIPGRACCGTSCTLFPLVSPRTRPFPTPCDDATVDAAELADRVGSHALRKTGEYDRVARIPAVRVHGCTLPPSAHVPDGMREVMPPSVPEGHDGLAQRAPVSVHRYLGITVYYVLHFFSGQRRPGDFQD